MNKPIYTDTSDIRLANAHLWIGKAVYENGFEFVSVGETKDEALQRAINSESVAVAERPTFMPSIGGTTLSNRNAALKVVGSNTFIRTFVPHYIQVNYDIYIFVNKDNYRDSCLIALNRNLTDVKPIYISCSAKSSLISIKNCLYYLTAFIIITNNNKEPEIISPKLYSWINNWIYKTPNVPLQAVLTRG